MKVTLKPNFQLYTVNFSTISQVYNFDAASQPPHLTCYSVYIEQFLEVDQAHSGSL